MLSLIRSTWPSNRLGTSLGVEVAAHLPLLPGLAAQLAETSRHIESAVGDVCSSFEGMVARAQASVAQAEGVTGGRSAGEGSHLLETLAHARGAFDILLARLTSASERARTGAERVNALQTIAKRVETSIAQVDSIAMSVRLLALNAKIEAAREGDRNAGFCVVATEMEHCAGQSSAIAEDVRAMTRELTSTLFSVAETLRLEADAAATDMSTSRAEIETALQSVEQAHDAIRKQLASAGDLSRDFTREIAAAVMALQFQDRVSQRVAHVVDALTYTHRALEDARPRLSARHRVQAERRRAEIAHQIHGMHTMAEERTAGAPVIAPLAAVASGDVELF